MSAKILAVEDSSESLHLLRRALGAEYHLETVSTFADAARRVETTRYDLILMDVHLPDGDGFRLCSLLRALHDAPPIIFITAKTSTADKVLGFQLGAEDFITKPFDSLELKARVDAKIRKLERAKIENDTVRCGDIEIHKSSQRVYVNEDGNSRQIDFTPIEFKILLLLAGQPNAVFNRDTILNTVWGQSVHVYSRSVDTHVSKVRKKLGNKADMIESVHGAGYRLVLSEPESARSLSAIQPQGLVLGTGSL